MVGDTAHLEHDGKPLHGEAQVAMQQGRYVSPGKARLTLDSRRAMSHPIALVPGARPEISLPSWTGRAGSDRARGRRRDALRAGWIPLAHRMPERFGAGRLIAVMAGLASVILALSSPLDALGHQLLLADMIQHLLLMAAAPPLL